jgi:hypothetical protein
VILHSFVTMLRPTAFSLKRAAPLNPSRFGGEE